MRVMMEENKMVRVFCFEGWLIALSIPCREEYGVELSQQYIFNETEEAFVSNK